MESEFGICINSKKKFTDDKDIPSWHFFRTVHVFLTEKCCFIDEATHYNAILITAKLLHCNYIHMVWSNIRVEESIQTPLPLICYHFLSAL